MTTSITLALSRKKEKREKKKGGEKRGEKKKKKRDDQLKYTFPRVYEIQNDDVCACVCMFLRACARARARTAPTAIELTASGGINYGATITRR